MKSFEYIVVIKIGTDRYKEEIEETIIESLEENGIEVKSIEVKQD